MSVLKEQGQFATFAYLQELLLPAGLRFRRMLRHYFREVSTSRTVWKNLPPAFVYRCRRRNHPTPFLRGFDQAAVFSVGVTSSDVKAGSSSTPAPREAPTPGSDRCAGSLDDWDRRSILESFERSSLGPRKSPSSLRRSTAGSKRLSLGEPNATLFERQEPGKAGLSRSYW